MRRHHDQKCKKIEYNRDVVYTKRRFSIHDKTLMHTSFQFYMPEPPVMPTKYQCRGEVIQKPDNEWIMQNMTHIAKSHEKEAARTDDKGIDASKGYNWTGLGPLPGNWDICIFGCGGEGCPRVSLASRRKSWCGYYPEFMGSFCIKKVAPAILGEEASYANLEIGDGLEAMLAYGRLIFLSDGSEEKVALRTAMLEYCEQDTMLMVKLHHWLQDEVMGEHRLSIPS